MRILIVLLFGITVFASNPRILTYIGKHPELNREIIEALQNKELTVGMNTEQVVLIMGLPLQKEIVDIDGQNVLMWTYKNKYLFFVSGAGWLLSNWEHRNEDK